MPSFDGYSVGANDMKVTVDDEGKSKREILNKDFDFQDWFSKNSPDVRMPSVLECSRELRKQYSWVGFAGYCWGGSVGFKIASRHCSGLFDCVSVAHPVSPTEGEVRSISVAFQIIAPEHDPTFTQELKNLCNKEIPKIGVPYLYYHFPGMTHGFATKCVDSKASEKGALERVKNAVVLWMTSHRGEK